VSTYAKLRSTNNISSENPTGITVFSCSGAVISNNYITNITDNYSRATGIETWMSNGTIIENNTIIGSSSAPIQPGCNFVP
jgi:nitrous oxidase accessory protein NosD